jgi:hypothetical protein
MREDLLKLLRRENEATHAIILTHNIDFVFLQSVVVPELRRCGNPTTTVFADAQCAASTYAYQAPILSNLGFRYRVVPVSMQPGFCFHPKAVFLSTPKKAVLFIGSGNLTFGGWRENGELWLRFDSEINGTGVFTAFRGYLEDITSLIALPESVRAEVAEAFDGSTHAWAVNLEEPNGLLGKAGKGITLVEQMLPFIGEGPIYNLTVCTPYFDPDAEAVKTLVEQLKTHRGEIYVQNGRTNLTQKAAQSLPAEVKVRPVNFLPKTENEEGRQRFLHAKFYALDQGEQITVFLGSANCSLAALTIPSAAGNAELLAMQALTPLEYRENYLTELEFLEEEPQLLEEYTNSEEPQREQGTINLLAARYEGGLLQLGVRHSAGVTLTGCLVDDVKHDIEIRSAGLVWVRLIGTPRTVKVMGVHGGQEVTSNPCWVDHEHELRATARIRSLAGIIRNRVTSGHWQMGAWAEVMGEFFKHLQYMPAEVLTKITSQVSGQEQEEKPSFSHKDVFGDGYGLRFEGYIDSSYQDKTWTSSLRQLLLQWLGIGTHDDLEERIEDPPPPSEGDDEPDSHDRPKELPKSPRPKPPVEITEGERKKALKILSQVFHWMSHDNYLRNREPGFLAIDLKIASALMRVALREKWITPNNFFDYTQQLWLPLFFTSQAEKHTSRGWLDYRYNTAEDPNHFAALMASPELAAAMAAWALAISAEIQTPAYARFRLACVLSVARLPWLWRVDPEDQIATELQKILSLTPLELADDRWQAISEEWSKLMRQGEALRRLEVALGGRQPVMLKKDIRQDYISAGEILWQGQAGFLIALSATKRSLKEPVQVLYLQPKPGKPDESYWSKDGKEFLIPLKALLDEGVITSSDFGDNERKELANLIKELAQGFLAETIF